MKKKSYDLQYHKKHSARFRISSVALLVLLLLLLGAGLVACCYMCARSPGQSQSGFAIIMLAYIALSAAITAIYFFALHRPITRVIKATRDLLDGNFDFMLPESAITEYAAISRELNGFVASIRQIIDSEYYTKILKKRAELNALQSQINPHFLYNTIDCIRGQALSEGSESIADMAKALSSVFRYTVSGGSSVTVADELEHVKNYIAIQQYRFNNRFDIDISVEKGGADILACPVPRLIIQPFVENAIVHGFETKPGRGRITIRLASTQSRLIITVEDDGNGIPPDKLRKLNDSLSAGVSRILDGEEGDASKEGVALVNVNERIRIMYGDIYGVRVYSTYGVGTMCEITLPAAQNKSAPPRLSRQRDAVV